MGYATLLKWLEAVEARQAREAAPRRAPEARRPRPLRLAQTPTEIALAALYEPATRCAA